MKNKKLFAILTLVCFMFTLMPVAAFAADPYIWVEDGDEAVKLDENDEAKVKFNLSDVDGDAFYVFAMKDGVLSTKMEDKNGETGFLKYTGISSNFTATFTAAGEYTVYAVMATDYENTLVDNNGNAKSNTQIAKELIANSDNMVTMYNNVIKVKAVSTNPETSYKAETNLSGHVPTGKTEDFTFTGKLTNVIPNNVFEKSVTVTFKDGEDVLKGKEVTVETNSAAIEVNKETATTNAAGKVTVKVAASIEGDYEIYFTVDGITWTLKVSVGNTAAAYIETTKAPTAPLAQYAAWDGDEIEFYVTDINGNAVDNFAGMSEIADKNENYVVLTEAPADSDLESDELSVVGGTNGIYTLSGVKLDAEGTYAVKVILDNGAYATAKWEVKKFQTPVMLIIGASTDVVELGGTLVGELIYVDANGVQKDADDADFTGTGYAAAEADKLAGGNKFVVKAKSDEKYVGAKISTTAVSTKYDLVATKEFKVIDGAAAIAFVDKAADVNVNNKLTWNVVDSTGTRVTLNSYNSVDGLATVEVTDIKYIVLDKPADAKVSVNDASNENDLTTKGIGKMSLTSNKVGNVTVQVVLNPSWAIVQTEFFSALCPLTGISFSSILPQVEHFPTHLDSFAPQF